MYFHLTDEHPPTYYATNSKGQFVAAIFKTGEHPLDKWAVSEGKTNDVGVIFGGTMEECFLHVHQLEPLSKRKLQKDEE